ncbi:MAG: DNA ligase D [Planctomycetota bacterium]
MALDRYRQKRDFAKTPEPRDARSATGDRRLAFVVQKHAATRLHHDFRLEWNGELLSWAVPKGPPTRVGQKVLAVRTENHPTSYGDFEGVIPEGQYGAGSVMLWDRGQWRPRGDPERGLVEGSLDFDLEGERLAGHWTLKRMDGDAEDEKENWLLIKRSDDGASSARAAAPEVDASIATGRNMAEIAAGVSRHGSSLDPASLAGARRADPPTDLTPELATLAPEAPAGDDWLHEIKFDGYRILAFCEGGTIRLVSRRGQDWTGRFPRVARALERLGTTSAILDGEVVVLDEDGRSSFQALQRSLGGDRDAEHDYYLFDLPYFAGYDLRRVQLVERKRLLAAVLEHANGDTLHYSEHVVGQGPAFFEHACRLGLEGAVSKRRDSSYQSRRSRSWIKTKCQRRQEFVIGGMSAPAGSRIGFGALLVGTYDDEGALHYAGRVGTGFSDRVLVELEERLAPLETPESPFVERVRDRNAATRWVEPELVAEVAFTEWTAGGLLRHPSFQGLREDKPARDVRRETTSVNMRTAKNTQKNGGPKRVDVDARIAATGVEFTHPDRVLYPEQGGTKLDLARYYASVAERFLPHVADRPLTIVRCPRGHAAKCFYQKHATDGIVAPVRALPVREREGRRDYLAVDDLAGVLALVQLGVLEFHPWGSRANRIERPDRLVLDIDPGPGVEWSRVIDTALQLRQLLEALDLASWPRTTGGKGLHVVVPIDRRTEWDAAKEFTRNVVARLAETDPDAYVLTARKTEREGRVYLDYLRNARGATAIASYSTRAKPGAPVATPLAWDEVVPGLDPAAFTIATVPARVAAARDPWAALAETRQSLTSARLDAVRAAIR